MRGLVGDLNSIFTLNETGSLIWSMLDSPRRESDLIAALVDAFEVSPEDARADVRGYLDRLLAAGMIRPPVGVERLMEAQGPTSISARHSTRGWRANESPRTSRSRSAGAAR